jgi:uncharacterized protein YajQ (UPF0234 family)
MMPAMPSFDVVSKVDLMELDNALNTAEMKAVKDAKLKVQAQIQGEELRVTGKNRDDLQSAIALLRRGEYGLDLQFVNFRD